jgi:hypothetical protein
MNLYFKKFHDIHGHFRPTYNRSAGLNKLILAAIFNAHRNFQEEQNMKGFEMVVLNNRSSILFRNETNPQD